MIVVDDCSRFPAGSAAIAATLHPTAAGIDWSGRAFQNKENEHVERP